jgi:hypothetical protein
MNKGERAITIDEVPLDWCFQPGVKLDFRKMEDGHVITAREVEDELIRIGLAQAIEIVVVTRAGSRYGSDDYVNSGCSMGYDATIFLLERASVSPAPTPGAGTRRSISPPEMGEGPRSVDHLGRPQGRPRHRLLHLEKLPISSAAGRQLPSLLPPRSAAPRPAGRARWQSSRSKFCWRQAAVKPAGPARPAAAPSRRR